MTSETAKVDSNGQLSISQMIAVRLFWLVVLNDIRLDNRRNASPVVPEKIRYRKIKDARRRPIGITAKMFTGGRTTDISSR